MKVVLYLDDKPGIKRELDFDCSSGSVTEFIQVLKKAIPEEIDFTVDRLSYFDSEVDEYLILEDVKELKTEIVRIKIRTKSKTFCAIHEGEKRNLFCCIHCSLCCPHCVIFGEHKKCKDDILPMKKAVKHCKMKLDSLQLPNLLSNANKNLKNISNQLIEHEKFNESLSASIEEAYNEILQKLRNKFDEIHSELKTTAIDSLNNIKSSQVIFQTASEVIGRNQEFSDNFEFLDWATVLLSLSTKEPITRSIPCGIEVNKDQIISGVEKLTSRLRISANTTSYLPVCSLLSPKSIKNVPSCQELNVEAETEPIQPEIPEGDKTAYESPSSTCDISSESVEGTITDPIESMNSREFPDLPEPADLSPGSSPQCHSSPSTFLNLPSSPEYTALPPPIELPSNEKRSAEENSPISLIGKRDKPETSENHKTESPSPKRSFTQVPDSSQTSGSPHLVDYYFPDGDCFIPVKRVPGLSKLSFSPKALVMNGTVSLAQNQKPKVSLMHESLEFEVGEKKTIVMLTHSVLLYGYADSMFLLCAVPNNAITSAPDKDPTEKYFSMIFTHDIYAILQKQCDLRPNVKFHSVGSLTSENEFPEKKDLLYILQFYKEYSKLAPAFDLLQEETISQGTIGFPHPKKQIEQKQEEEAKIILSPGDIASLQPGCSLTFNIILFYTQHIRRSLREKLKNSNSFYFIDRFFNIAPVSRPSNVFQTFCSSLSVNEEIFSRDFIVIPVRQESRWFLIVVASAAEMFSSGHAKNARIHFIGAPGTHYNTAHTSRRLKDFLMFMWQKFNGREIVPQRAPYNRMKPKAEIRDEDSGIFLLHYIEQFLEDPNWNLEDDRFSPLFVQEKRKEILALIAKSQQKELQEYQGLLQNQETQKPQKITKLKQKQEQQISSKSQKPESPINIDF